MSQKYPFAETMQDLLKRGKGLLGGVPLVAPIIPRTGAWTGDNQIGRRAPYGPDNRGRQTILKMDEWGPPEIWTVSLFILTKFKLYDGFNVRANINFGVGGSTQTYECDWLNGAQISLPMNAINVEAIFENVDISTEGAGLELSVQIARGSRGGTRPPVNTISENLVVANASTSSRFDIPKFAKKIVFVPSTMSAAGRTAFFASTTQVITSTGNDVGASDVAIGSGDKAIGIGIEVPVTGEARFVRISNTGAQDLRGTLYAELEG